MIIYKEDLVTGPLRNMKHQVTYQGTVICNPLSIAVDPDALFFIILLCLMPADFTHQGESAATQWVNQTICQCILLAV